MEDLKKLTKRVFANQTPPQTSTRKAVPQNTASEVKREKKTHDDEEEVDDDNLMDDVEDKNASFSDFSQAKGGSTQNTSRSGNSSGSGS